MNEILMTIAFKFKAVLLASVAAWGAATMRYYKQKRAGKTPTLTSWFAFGMTSFLVTYTFFIIAFYLYPTAPNSLLLAIGYWIGFMSDYFYSWIPIYIKNKLPKIKDED